MFVAELEVFGGVVLALVGEVEGGEGEDAVHQEGVLEGLFGDVVAPAGVALER